MARSAARASGSGASRLVPPGAGDGVGGPLRPAGGADPGHTHQPVALQPAEGGVDLAKLQRAAEGEPLVIGALEVVAVVGLSIEQPEQGVRDGHGPCIH